MNAGAKPVRESLLRAAVALFARSGYDGVSVDAIVGAAGVNKRMVYHYFGSKEGIYLAALEHVYLDLEKLEALLFATREAHEDPAAALGAIVGVYFQFLRAHPEFVRLLLWENLQEGRHLAGLNRTVSKNPMLGHLDIILKAGVRKRVFRDDLDSKMVLISLIGLCLVYFSNRHTLSLTVGLDLASPRALKEAAEHTSAILLRGVRI